MRAAIAPILAIVLCIVPVSCTGVIGEVPDGPGVLVSWQYRGHLTEAGSELDYYSIIYRTTCKGESVVASALVMIPEGVESSDILVYNHGSVAPLDKVLDVAMSEYDGQSYMYQVDDFVIPFAADGYYVVAPDYVGYGVSAGYEHPYMYCPELAVTGIDAVCAMEEFLEEQGLHYGCSLFLTGWSQGASVALAMQKYIEAGGSRWNVTVSALSGAYDFANSVKEIMSHPDKLYPVMFCYAWTAYALNLFAPAMGIPNDRIFRKNVTDQSSALLTSVGSTPGQVFLDSFRAMIVSGNDDCLNAAVESNSYCGGWTPRGKVFLHHGISDVVVPCFNSVNACEGLTEAGGDVTLYTYEGGGHFSLFDEYLVKTLEDFKQFRQYEQAVR